MRFRSSQRGVTLFEVSAIGGCLAVLATGAALWFGGEDEMAGRESAVRTAAHLRRAVEAWQADNGQACPTVSQLIHEDYLDAQTREDDTWGNRFRIVCDPDAKIIAAGPDRKVGTKDDIVERIVTD